MTHDIDPPSRRLWHDAGDALTHQVQGRLRAARRTALDAPSHARSPAAASRLRWIGVPATVLAAVFAIALLLPRGEDAPAHFIVATHVATPTPAAGVAAVPLLAATDPDTLDALTLEDDPDFYLWLAGDDMPAATREVPDESI